MTPEQLATIGDGINAALAAVTHDLDTQPCWGVIAPASYKRAYVGTVNGIPYRWVVVGGCATREAMHARAGAIPGGLVVELPPRTVPGGSVADAVAAAMAAQYPR